MIFFNVTVSSMHVYIIDIAQFLPYNGKLMYSPQRDTFTTLKTLHVASVRIFAHHAH